ncbi:MAG: DNA topoisomerase VI subunit B [Nitrososphaeria archaeon]
MPTAGHEIFSKFEEYSVAEFFKKNRQMLGYSGKIRSLTTIIHEYVTNSLDACEDAGILPEIYVEIKKLGPEHYLITVHDNGPGIPKKYVGKALGKMLAGTKFKSFKQSRGQQGIGASGCILYGQITTGKPTLIRSAQGDGKVYSCAIMVDTQKNEPRFFQESEYVDPDFKGLWIQTEVKEVLYQKGENSPDEYLRRTALANPHAKIIYVDPDGLKTVYERSVSVLPKLPKASKPHLKGVNADDLISLAQNTSARTIRGFLIQEFSRVSSQKVNEIQQKVNFDLNKRPKDMTWEEAEQIISAVQQIKFIAPPGDILVPIGEKHIEQSLDAILKPEFKVVKIRPAGVYRGGIPFQVEIAMAYGGNSGKEVKEEVGGEVKTVRTLELMRFANRVPLLFDSGGCAITKAVQEVDWKRYNLRDNVPLTVMVNLVSVYVPYTGAGKQAVSDEEELMRELHLALLDCAREVQRYISGQMKRKEAAAKKQTLHKYAPEIATALSELLGIPKKEILDKLIELIESKYEKEELEESDEERMETDSTSESNGGDE